MHIPNSLIRSSHAKRRDINISFLFVVGRVGFWAIMDGDLIKVVQGRTTVATDGEQALSRYNRSIVGDCFLLKIVHVPRR